MRNRAHVAGAILLAASIAAPVRGAVIDLPLTPLIIRLYGVPSLPADRVEPAIEEANEILAEAGFAPEWLACAALPAAPARCAAPLEGTELAVRVTMTPPQLRTEAPYRPLGYSLVDPRTRSGSLATVYLDRVLWLADATGVDAGALLGRAIAHEIGHLLLGTNRHARSGVMRAVWSRDALRNSRPAEWRFLAGEARQMRAAVTAEARVNLARLTGGAAPRP